MKVDSSFNTVFASDDEAREYGRAAIAVMTTPAMDVPPERWHLIREWCFTAELKAGATREDAERRSLMMMTAVAPARILKAVLDHFGTLNPPNPHCDAAGVNGLDWRSLTGFPGRVCPACGNDHAGMC